MSLFDKILMRTLRKEGERRMNQEEFNERSNMLDRIVQLKAELEMAELVERRLRTSWEEECAKLIKLQKAWDRLIHVIESKPLIQTEIANALEKEGVENE